VHTDIRTSDEPVLFANVKAETFSNESERPSLAEVILNGGLCNDVDERGTTESTSEIVNAIEPTTYGIRVKRPYENSAPTAPDDGVVAKRCAEFTINTVIVHNL
jgi:hypothetical protein